MTICSVLGCNKSTSYGRSKHCESHYQRLRRRGTTEPYKPKERFDHSNGYILIRAPDHPLRQGKSGSYEYQHRVVFYDENGAGPFSCHWCDVGIDWESMHVDHVNDCRDDNRIANLVASCPRCNQKRGSPKSVRTLKSKGRLLSLSGREQCLGDWAREIGISRAALSFRLASGWSVERALTTPRGPTGPHMAPK